MSDHTVASRTIPLWDATVPLARGTCPEDIPTLDLYLPSGTTAPSGALAIFPGGSYTFLSPKSGAEYAQWLVRSGIAGAVVSYRLGSAGYRGPALLEDAVRALALLRERGAEWNVDPQRVGVIGTSAGGHLAALLATDAISAAHPHLSFTPPRVAVLCYPVISLQDPLAHAETRSNFLGDQANDVDSQRRYSAERHVTGNTPPCFIWHTLTDREVSSENSEHFATAVRAAGVEYELHLYSRGAHALGLAQAEGLRWADDCRRWLTWHGF